MWGLQQVEPLVALGARSQGRGQGVREDTSGPSQGSCHPGKPGLRQDGGVCLPLGLQQAAPAGCPSRATWSMS